MLKHFKNLRTSLSIVHQYPTTTIQQRRFHDLGWHCARGRTLWDLWGDDKFLNAWQRASLNTIEPFDEWEEFALFASHYFLLVATKYSSLTESSLGIEWYLKAGQLSSLEKAESHAAVHKAKDSSSHLSLYHSDIISATRRFGALLQRADETVELHGGFSLQTRATDSQLFIPGRSPLSQSPRNFLPHDMKSRACHSITLLRTSTRLNILVGGRASPREAFSDCWSQGNDGVWRKEPSLPTPLYRHSAISIRLGRSAVDDDAAILIYGGRSTNGRVMNDWYLGFFPIAADGHRGTIQWSCLVSEGSTLRPRFGSSLMTIGKLEGVLLGGMSEDGTILNEMYHWTLKRTSSTYVVHVEDQINSLMDLGRIVCRVGATVTSNDGLKWTMVGGIASNGMVPDSLQIIHVEFRRSQTSIIIQWQPINFDTPLNAGCPLFIGHQAVTTSDGVAIVGGGANCFSFGTYWSHRLWLLSSDREKVGRWHEVEKEVSGENSAAVNPPVVSPVSLANLTSVPTMKVNSKSCFQNIIRAATPVVIEGLALGSCSAKWTLSYLREAMGPDRQVRYPPLLRFSNCLHRLFECLCLIETMPTNVFVQIWQMTFVAS